VCLCLGGCALEDVNSVSIIDYDRWDNAGTVALKTLGNVVLTAAATPFMAGAMVLVAVANGSTTISGGISRSGVKIKP
jgi:hypothetical protein